ncbi:MAG: hypothetical protein PHE49_10835 [bacterium]|nr:hypothetical protein [bacterium]
MEFFFYARERDNEVENCRGKEDESDAVEFVEEGDLRGERGDVDFEIQGKSPKEIPYKEANADEAEGFADDVISVNG